MENKAQMIVSKLLDRAPEISEVLQWHGIELTEMMDEMSLGEVCKRFQVELEDLIEELETHIDLDAANDEIEPEPVSDSFSSDFTAEEDGDEWAGIDDEGEF